jgi:HSP90 family molecular chaperone
MEAEKAKKTRKKAEKSGNEEGVKEKRAKNTRKKVNEEAALEQRAKIEALKNEALDFYRQLRERGLTTFDGASVDFHKKRDPVVFIPRREPSNCRREERRAKELLGDKQRPQSACRCLVSETGDNTSIVAGTRNRGLHS